MLNVLKTILNVIDKTINAILAGIAILIISTVGIIALYLGFKSSLLAGAVALFIITPLCFVLIGGVLEDWDKTC